MTEREWTGTEYTPEPEELTEDQRQARAHRLAAERALARGDLTRAHDHEMAADILDAPTPTEAPPVPHVPDTREEYASWAAVGGDASNRGDSREGRK